MPFYTQQHYYYWGIDLHARLLAICIVNQAGIVALRQQIPDDKQLLLELLAPEMVMKLPLERLRPLRP